MKLRDLITIAKYLNGSADKSLKVQVVNADSTKQDCDIKDVSIYTDALVLNIDTDFFIKSPRKFCDGQFVIHKDDNQDVVYQPYQIIQVDEAERKYRLDNGSVIHFSEEEDYETTVSASKCLKDKYYNKAIKDVLNAVSENMIISGLDVVEILDKLQK